jgi:hypothetical protein
LAINGKISLRLSLKLKICRTDYRRFSFPFRLRRSRALSRFPHAKKLAGAFFVEFPIQISGNGVNNRPVFRQLERRRIADRLIEHFQNRFSSSFCFFSFSSFDSVGDTGDICGKTGKTEMVINKIAASDRRKRRACIF